MKKTSTRETSFYQLSAYKYLESKLNSALLRELCLKTYSRPFKELSFQEADTLLHLAEKAFGMEWNLEVLLHYIETFQDKHTGEG